MIPLDQPRWLIPECIILACDHCGHVWFQTLGRALLTPLDPITCPHCGEEKCYPPEVDSPFVVGGSK